MVVEYIRYRVPQEEQDAFERGYSEAEKSLAASCHCLGYELSRCLEEPERYILRIEWDSVEGHLQGFRRSEEFRTFLGHIRAFVPLIEEMQHYQLTGIRSAARMAEGTASNG